MSDNTIIVNRFKKFIRVSLQNHSINLHKKHSRLKELEIELEDAMLYDEAVYDEYSFLENFVRVMDFNIMIKNDLLYEALRSMEQRHRDIVYLSLCESWSDKQIGQKLNMSRSSVQRIKKRLHDELKRKLVGGEEDDE